MAYFMTSGAMSYACRGTSGQTYQFTAIKPVTVKAQDDVTQFRKNSKLSECDAEGDPISGRGTPKPSPLSYKRITPTAKKTTSRRPEDNASLMSRPRG